MMDGVGGRLDESGLLSPLGVVGACDGGRLQCFVTSFLQARMFDYAGGVL